MPVNTDGGLIANGEPIGASGLRQMHELVKQLRGEAGERQVPNNPKVGLRAGLRRARGRVGDGAQRLNQRGDVLQRAQRVVEVRARRRPDEGLANLAS